MKPSELSCSIVICANRDPTEKDKAHQEFMTTIWVSKEYIPNRVFIAGKASNQWMFEGKFHPRKGEGNDPTA